MLDQLEFMAEWLTRNEGIAEVETGGDEGVD